MIDHWKHKSTGKQGGQSLFTDLAIKACLTLRLFFKQGLRQTEGLVTSLLNLSRNKLVNTQLIPTSDENEVSTIRSALNNSHGRLRGMREHLKASINLISERNNPDYRNSIKESISAVEPIAMIIADEPKA